MTRSFWLVCAATSALAFALGCSDTVVEGEEGGSGGSGGTGAGGIGAGGTGGTGATGAGGYGGGHCDAYLDQTYGSTAVTVRFVNQSGLPIYLPANCGNVLYSITPLGGSDGTTYAYDPFCLQTCQDLMSEGIIDCAACEATTILLEPGGSHEVLWPGTGLADIDMPDECWAMPGSQQSCPQISVASPGDYRIEALGYASCADGTCTCDPDGVCSGSPTGMQAYADSTVFTHANQNLVEVIFGVCAFPCPSGS